ncbi:MAG: right-handed parallel beta-helix repeat-containing protein [Kiritimatiellae bacterium]|nr:right-handed parallel beta-helix repeat-containing protein [Kiritimatiellia bacterium]
MTGYNVRDFGAKGDGKTDDTAAIQRAIDQAAQAQGTVYVPEGVFLSSTLALRPNTGLLGNPTWEFRNFGGSIIRLNDEEADCLIDITGAYGCTIQGMCLDGGKLGHDTHGVLLKKDEQGKREDTPLIDGCRIGRFTGSGIHFVKAWCFSLRHNMICHNGGDGLYLGGWDGFILDNWFSGNGKAGIGAYQANASITMTGNRIEWNRRCGIVVYGGNHYTICGNYVDRSGGPAIALLHGDPHPCLVFSITGNILYRSGKAEWPRDEPFESTHIQFERAQGVVFSGNTLCVGRDDGAGGEWSPDHAMVFGSLDGCMITNNVMHNGARKELIVDRGNNTNTVVKDNVGSIGTLPW